MKNKVIISIIVYLFSANAFAAKSIMFQGQEDNNSGSQNITGDNERQQAKCMDLRNQIAKLKGKPLRRTELKNRHQEECLGNRRGTN